MGSILFWYDLDAWKTGAWYGTVYLGLFREALAIMEKTDVSSSIWEDGLWEYGLWEQTRFSEVLRSLET